MSSSISVALSATVVPFKAQMVAAGEAVRTFSGEVQAAAVKNDKAVRAMAVGMAAVGAAAVAMAAVSVKSAIDLEERMQNVATIWTDTSTTVTAAGDQIVDMSRRLPQSANNLAEGLYQVASSGFQGAAGMQVLEASATAASAGLTTTAVAATGITAVLNAYGMTAGQAAHVSDVLFQTVNLGVVTFEELSNTLGDFVGIASVAGISIEDATTAFATMTLSGLGAAEAGTAVSRTIQAIIQPSKEMAATLTAAGYASGQAALNALGLKGVIELLNTATGGSATAMGTLVPEMRALRGVLALSAADGANYTRVAAGMTDQSVLLGATQRALAEQAKSTSFQFGIFKNTVAAVGIAFGQSLLPVIKPIIGLFQSLADTFLSLPGPVQLIVAGVGFLTAAAIGLVGAFLLLAPSIAAATTLIGGSTVAMGALTTAFWALDSAMPVIGLIGAALAIATPFVLMWAKAHGDAKRQVDDLAKSLDAETGAVTANTTALITDQIVKQNLNGTAATLGISLDTLTSAMLGNKDAIAEVHEKTALTADEQAALNDRISEGVTADYGSVDAKTKLAAAVDGGNSALGKAIDQTKVHASVQAAATRATKDATAASDAQAQKALDDATAISTLTKALNGISGISAVLSATTSTAKTGQADLTDTVKTAVNERQQVEKDALAQTQKVEKDSLDVRNTAAKAALDTRQKAEVAALALTQRSVIDALDVKFRTETDAYDREAQAQKDALDTQQRAEKDALDFQQRAQKEALDAIQADIDRATDQKKRDEDKAYGDEKDRLQFLVDSTFGAEREGYKAQLTTLEDSHADKLSKIDQAGGDQKQALKDGLDDQQTIQKNALDDQQTTEKEGLANILTAVKEGIADRQAAEKQAVDDAYTAKVNALKAAQDAEDLALGVTLKALTDNLDLKQQAVTRQLQNRQTAEDNAADARRSSAQTKADLSLADVQTQLDTANKTQAQALVDLKTIYTRGGGDVTAAMLVEIAKLPPQVVTELANAGQPAFDKFIGALKTGVAGVDAVALAKSFEPVGAAAATGFVAGWGAPGSVSQGLLGVLSPLFTVKTNAEGSVSRQAMVSSDPILWAEAGPEAYIPLSRDKANRSVPLLAQAASMFGYGVVPMANGGIRGGGGGVTSISMPIHIEAHVAAHADPDSVGRAIAVHTDRVVTAAFDRLGRQVVNKAWRN